MNSMIFSPLYKLWQNKPRFFNNPVVKRELIERLRRGSSFFYLFLFVGLVFIITLTRWYSYTNEPVEFQHRYSRNSFMMLNFFMGLFVMFLLPIISATRINMEFERDSWDLLQTTHLNTASILLGKFLSALLFLGLLIASLIPFYGIYFIVGGIGPNEILLTFLMLLEGSIIITLIGLFCSGSLSKTVNAITMSYVLNLMFFAGPIFMIVILHRLLSPHIRNEIISFFLITTSPFAMGFSYIEQPPLNPFIISLLPWFHSLFMLCVMALLVWLNFLAISQRGKGGLLSLFSRLTIKKLIFKKTSRSKSNPSIRSVPDRMNPVFWKENVVLDGSNKSKQRWMLLALFGFGLLIVVFQYIESRNSRIWGGLFL